MQVNQFNAFEKVFKHTDKVGWFFNQHKSLISVELDLTNLCDSKCRFCTGQKDKKVSLTLQQVKSLADELSSEFDCRSVIISGGGEPLLHPNFGDCLYYLRGRGLKLGLNSNALTLDEDKAKAIIDCCDYFRVSLDAGSAKMYEYTHGLGKDRFEGVLENIKMFSSLKRKHNSDIAFGTGFLTSQDTKSDIQNFFRVSRDCGVDFAQLRPYTGDFTPMQDELRLGEKTFASKEFRVTSSRQKYDRFGDEDKRPYKKCRGLFFNTVVCADYRVFACLHHRQDDAYLLGDLNQQSLKDIWTSARIRGVYENINLSGCPFFCRNDDINRALSYIAKPVNHKDFL